MSLIPSESYSFPDDFTRKLAASRKLTNEDPASQPAQNVRKEPATGALPNSKAETPPPAAVIRENGEPVRKAAPPVLNPALRRASAPPPRISEARVRKIALPAALKPNVRWNTQTPAVDPNNGNGAEHFPYEPLMPPAGNVQMSPPLASRSRVMPRPENLVQSGPFPVAGRSSPIPVAPSRKPGSAANPVKSFHGSTTSDKTRLVTISNSQGDSFETFAQSTEAVLLQRCQKAKMRRFLVCESIALGVLLSLATIGMWRPPENAALLWILGIFTSAAAAVLATIPVFFFALRPTSSQTEG